MLKSVKLAGYQFIVISWIDYCFLRFQAVQNVPDLAKTLQLDRVL